LVRNNGKLYRLLALLRKDLNPVSSSKMQYFKGKRVLITGACGTVGTELVRLLLEDSSYSPDEIVGIDNNESELFFLDQKYVNDTRASFFLADIRDRDALCHALQGIDIVFHAGALKHVTLCERSPYEAVQTNIIGVENLIFAAMANAVGKVIFTSSDKAVNPTNVMGTSKLMGERLITAANSNQREPSTIFASTRFGNVLGSNGSVIPIFEKQILQGGPITLTDESMTRFVMSIEQAARLVLNSAQVARGGEVFVTKMPVIGILNLAEVMCDELAPRYGFSPDKIEIRLIGTKPGEKLYEELMSDEETRRSLELDQFFAVLPAFRGFYNNIDYSYDSIVNDVVDNPYNSHHEIKLSKSELKRFLIENKLIGYGADLSEVPSERYWPGDKESHS